MSKSFGAVNFVALLFVVALLFGYLSYVQKEKDEIERLKLSYAIDYAADAGAMAMLYTEELDMDYAQNLSFTVDPQLALDTFLEVFCFNYNLYPNDTNKALIKDFIPVAAVAAVDGFYIASHEVVATGDQATANSAYHDLVFGMKMPYTYRYQDATYALQMGWNGAYKLTTTSLVREEQLPPVVGGIMTEEQAKSIITDIVSNEMAYQIHKTNEANPHWRHYFYIPGKLAASGVNPVEGPGFFVLVQNLNLTTSRPISGFSISGTAIQTANMLVGYTRDGAQYYTYDRYAHLLPPHVDIDQVFSSQEEAAQANYYPDLSYMREP